MKKLLLLSTFALGAWTAAEAFEADLDGAIFNIDTVYHHIVGPGVTQTKYYVSNGAGRSFNVYTSSMTRSEGAKAGLVEPRVVIGNDKCQIGEQITSMAERHSKGDYRLLTGINGDFFITSSFAGMHHLGNAILGYPNMSCVIDRKVAAPDMIDVVSRDNALIVTNDNWYIDATDMTYLLTDDGVSFVNAQAINYPRLDNEARLYNSYMGATTSTTGGKDLLLHIDPEAEWCMNQQIKFHVDGSWVEGGNMAIPEDGLVISCGPTCDPKAIEDIDNLVKDGVVYLQLGLSLPAHENISPDILQVIGGDVRILNQGEITREAIRWINTPSSPYQRSLVGFSKDRDMMVFAAVDGTGLNYYESAALMREFGCYDALDFDGGGSTAIWSDAFGIYNNPRDGSLRAIGNALFFGLKSPEDNVVTSIRFADYKKTLPRYGTYSPIVYGYNQYGQLIDTDVKGFSLAVPDHLGTASEDGTTLYTGEWPGTYLIEAVLGDMKATLEVTVADDCPIEMRHPSLLVDNYHPVAIELFSKINREELPVAASSFTWVSKDETIATVDMYGVIRGIADGTTQITGTLGEQVLNLDVIVECPTARLYTLAGNDSEDWSTSGTGTKVSSFTISEDKSISIDFNITNARAPKVTLRREMLLWSRPDAVEVVVNPGDLEISSAAITITPNGEKQVSVSIDSLKSNTDNVLTFPISDFADVNNPGIYPLTFRSLTFSVPMPKGDGYHFDIKSINAVYNSFEAGVSDISVENSNLKPIVIGNQISLGYEADAVYLYDLTGRIVASAKSTSSLAAPGPGIYILCTRSATKNHSTKIIIR